MLPRQRLILILLVAITAVVIALLGAALAQPAQANPTDLALPGGYYLSTENLQWLSLVGLVPLAVAFGFVWQHERPVMAFLQPELLGTFGAWIALANGYAVAFILPLVKILPTLDPPLTSINDPVLTQIPVSIVGLLLIGGTIAFYVWFLFLRQRGFGGLADRINLPHRRAALLMLLSFLAMAVWLFGGLAFAALMVLPAWLWIFIEPGLRPSRKIINVVLAVAGIVPFVAALALLPPGFNLWHLLMAVAYGVLWPIDVLMFLMLTALFIRFVRFGLSAPYRVPGNLPTQAEIIERLIK
jgi:hypothetical protein